MSSSVHISAQTHQLFVSLTASLWLLHFTRCPPWSIMECLEKFSWWMEKYYLKRKCSEKLYSPPFEPCPDDMRHLLFNYQDCWYTLELFPPCWLLIECVHLPISKDGVGPCSGQGNLRMSTYTPSCQSRSLKLTLIYSSPLLHKVSRVTLSRYAEMYKNVQNPYRMSS